MNAFAKIFTVIATATLEGFDTVTVWGSGATTRIRFSSSGRAVNKVVTLDAPLPFVTRDIRNALEIENWGVERTGHGLNALRPTESSVFATAA